MTASPAATSEMDQLDQLEGLTQRREQQKQITTSFLRCAADPASPEPEQP